MLDEASAFDRQTDAATPLLQRARGSVHVSAKLRGDTTVLDRLFQSGSAKARVPRGSGFEVVLLNTAGGVTGGDRFENAIEAAPDTHVTVTTQTAERIYRSTGADGHVTNTLTLGEMARLDWLPQETILFDHARLSRHIDVEMTETATLLAIEPLVLGRAAMGETVTQAFLSEQWRVRRNGRLVYADALRLDGEVNAITSAAASLNGAIASASLLYVAPNAEDQIGLVREALQLDGGASAWNNLLAA